MSSILPIKRLRIYQNIFLFIILSNCLILNNFTLCDQFTKSIQTLANKFGKQMLNIGYEKTCFARISKNFPSHSSDIKQIDVTRLIKDMQIGLVNMFNWKKEAVKRIAIDSEKLASMYTYEKDINYDEYYNMKHIYDDRFEKPESTIDSSTYKRLHLSSHPNFEDALVNSENSAVHIPINVYEQASDILNDIKWSESLTETFRNNLANDPSLSWQFFGSSKGFIRIYPATKWRDPYDSSSKSKTPDLYDCRMRQWYIQAAASPKDLVILLDVSGSMTGLRRNIAQNVVYNLLDTLTEDDYVIVLKFTNEIKSAVSCMNQLVQATKRNIREIKENVELIKTADVANFTLALIEAFSFLKNLSRLNEGSQCNQAIMLITDGAPETFEPIFKKYNPDTMVRLFTYVIGREVTQIREVYWMACQNKGYYAQVANLAEVREQVQQYIPVMSRPLVLSMNRVYSWTPVYAHVSEIQLTDWIWEERVKSLKTKILQQSQLIEENVEIDDMVEEKKDNFTEEVIEVIVDDDQTQIPATPTIIEDDYRKKLFNIELEMAKLPSRKKKIQLMTTLSTPVFDHRKYINMTQKILIKNVYKESTPETIRIANLLGVAGIDVPIKEIEKMTPSFKVGVNGYSFMLTNNGKVLYHPDYRPIFQDMLKPYYSSVDFNEVEMSNITIRPRHEDHNVEFIRKELINGKFGSKKIAIKTHLDSMRRPVVRFQHYAYGKIEHTPFSFGIVLPEPYGSFRFMGQIDLKSRTKSENYTRYFTGNNWRVHPDWVYCDFPHKLSGLVPKTPEDAIMQFLEHELLNNNFEWKNYTTAHQRYDNVTCDKELLQSLIFDANATNSFQECSEFSRQFTPSQEKSIDIVNVFVSTRSGLTRFSNLFLKEEAKNKSENDYYILNKSIDEVYYKRAVDFYYKDNKAFVYSIPYEAAIKENEFFVTSSHAIFAGNGKMIAPVAVVGVQYNYSSFWSTFFSTVNPCLSEDIDCFVLDNNAFVMISKTFKQAGMFFGEINDDLLQDMVREKVYKKISFFDYQSVCINIINTSSSSISLMTPLNYIKNIFLWLSSHLLCFYFNLIYDHSWVSSKMPINYPDYNSFLYEVRFNKSRPKPCDKEFDLYELNKYSNRTLQFVHNCTTNECSRNYFVQNIPHSNLILVVLYKTCNCFESTSKFEHKEIIYNSSEICRFLNTEFVRKRPESCYNNHSQESEIKFCGRASSSSANIILVLILSFVNIRCLLFGTFNY